MPFLHLQTFSSVYHRWLWHDVGRHCQKCHIFDLEKPRGLESRTRLCGTQGLSSLTPVLSRENLIVWDPCLQAAFGMAVWGNIRVQVNGIPVHTVKAYEGSGRITPFTIALGTGWSWVVSLTSCRFIAMERAHLNRGSVGSTAGLDVL